MKKEIFILLCACFNFCISRECIPRKNNYQSVICICNSTYCDTIKRPPILSEDEYVMYTSSQAGKRFRMEKGTFHYQVDVKLTHDNTITTHSEETYQSLIGWGGAFTDSTGININYLSLSAKALLLRSYFSEDGIEYNLGRVPIGGTDFSTHPYSYDDGKPDPELKNWKLAPEDFEYKIPVIKEAIAASNNTLKLFAAAWIAPLWMKHNGKYTGPDFLKLNIYQSWADYFLMFLKRYKQEGLNFWGISTGNEPLTGLIPHEVPSVGWLPNHMTNFISEHFGPALRNSEFSFLKLIALDDQIYNYPHYIDTMFLLNKNTRKYVDGFGLHWYRNTEERYLWLTETQEKYPEKFILATEACTGSKFSNESGMHLGSWKNAEKYALDIIRDLQNWVTGWVDWNLVLDLQGGPNYIDNFVDAAIVVNRSSNEFYKQPIYYVMGHFAKFLPENSTRIKITQSLSNLEVVAFRRPTGETAAIILNTKLHSVTVNWIKENGKILSKSIPPKSIVTILYR